MNADTGSSTAVQLPSSPDRLGDKDNSRSSPLELDDVSANYTMAMKKMEYDHIMAKSQLDPTWRSIAAKHAREIFALVVFLLLMSPFFFIDSLRTKESFQAIASIASLIIGYFIGSNNTGSKST